jgi:predicted nucleic acid-binding protein
MIVLDTNVISALMQTSPEAAVVAWLDAQASDSVWTTSISVFEIRYGLAAMSAGKKRKSLQATFEKALQDELDRRVLDFDTAAATKSADIAAKLRAMGRPIDMRDVMIAGTVAAHQASFATRNSKHFADTGIPLLDPWQVRAP